MLNVAQPALTRQVQQLEAELGLELLLRMRRRTRLTDAGEALLKHAQTIKRDFERLKEDMQARRGSPKGRVVLGIPPTLAEMLVSPVTRRICREFPLISIKVVEGPTPVLSDWVQSNKVDLAILCLSLLTNHDDTLCVEQVAIEDIVVAEQAGHPTPPHYELAALRTKRFIMSGILEETVRNQLGLSKLGLNIELEIDSIQAIKGMVIEGRAATLLPVSMLMDELAAGTMTASAITAQGVRRTLTLVQNRHRQMTRAFMVTAHIVREEIDRLRQEGVFSLNTLRARLAARERASSSADVAKTHSAGRDRMVSMMPMRG